MTGSPTQEGPDNRHPGPKSEGRGLWAGPSCGTWNKGAREQGTLALCGGGPYPPLRAFLKRDINGPFKEVVNILPGANFTQASCKDSPVLVNIFSTLAGVN